MAVPREVRLVQHFGEFHVIHPFSPGARQGRGHPATTGEGPAIGITNGTWRNSPLEDWHAEGRIHDGGMLRTNVATTKLVRHVLTDQFGAIIGGKGVPLIATEDLGDLEVDFSGELFMRLFERLSDPTRVLPDGRSLRQLAGQDLDDLVTWTVRSAGSPLTLIGTGLTSPCSVLLPTVGWLAPIGGERRGGPTS